jgi:hypothetical protein
VNVDPLFAPLPGGEPRLTASEIDDVVAFLNTLTDGYRASDARVSPASDIRSSWSSNHTVW